MGYIEVKFTDESGSEYIWDLLAADLGEIGFESFVNEEASLLAYIADDQFNEKNLKKVLDEFSFADNISFAVTSIEQKNWNEEWEKHYFEPIVIEKKCVIHSSFHKDVPQAEYDIVIDPKMSFGTGHHETTSLVIGEMLHLDFNDKVVLDMGCGTSVLAILAAYRGAKSVFAVDIDPWCVENSVENITLNKVDKLIDVQLGGVEILSGRHYDIILANINRNILLRDMEYYSESLNAGGIILFSGFYSEDIPLISEKAKKYGIDFELSHLKNNWAMVKARKI